MGVLINEQRIFYGYKRVMVLNFLVSQNLGTLFDILSFSLFKKKKNTCSELRTLCGFPWSQHCCTFCLFTIENFTHLNMHFIQTIPCHIKFSIQVLNISQFLMNSGSYSLWFFEFSTYSERIWSRQRMLVIWLQTNNFREIVHNLWSFSESMNLYQIALEKGKIKGMELGECGGWEDLGGVRDRKLWSEYII